MDRSFIERVTFARSFVEDHDHLAGALPHKDEDAFRREDRWRGRGPAVITFHHRGGCDRAMLRRVRTSSGNVAPPDFIIAFWQARQVQETRRMRFIKTSLEGALLVEPELLRDERGYFSRTFCAREFGECGLETTFVQHSRSFSARTGTLRGMHFQRAPHSEVKVVTCVSGMIWDVILDLRPGSRTHRKWQSFELSATNRRSLYVPAGFAHGFQTMADDTEVDYLISAYYEPTASTGLRYDDPAFAITWPLAISVISERDQSWPLIEPTAEPPMPGKF